MTLMGEGDANFSFIYFAIVAWSGHLGHIFLRERVISDAGGGEGSGGHQFFNVPL